MSESPHFLEQGSSQISSAKQLLDTPPFDPAQVHVSSDPQAVSFKALGVPDEQAPNLVEQIPGIGVGATGTGVGT